MVWISAFSKRHGVSISVLLGMAGLWQILSMVFTAEAVPGEPMVPGWQIVFSRTLLSLADDWQGGVGVPSVAEGAPRSYPAAFLSTRLRRFPTVGPAPGITPLSAPTPARSARSRRRLPASRR